MQDHSLASHCQSEPRWTNGLMECKAISYVSHLNKTVLNDLLKTCEVPVCVKSPSILFACWRKCFAKPLVYHILQLAVKKCSEISAALECSSLALIWRSSY